jgi:hypothetical protein
MAEPATLAQPAKQETRVQPAQLEEQVKLEEPAKRDPKEVQVQKV